MEETSTTVTGNTRKHIRKFQVVDGLLQALHKSVKRQVAEVCHRKKIEELVT